METLLFLYLVTGCIGIVSLIFYVQDNREALHRFGKNLGKFTLVLLFVVIPSLKLRNPSSGYRLSRDLAFWEKHHLPQIDSTMYLKSSGDFRSEYYSWSKDSIRHSEKGIRYDLFEVHSVTDVFRNEKTNQYLSVIFRKRNFLRDSLRIHTLRDMNKVWQQQLDTITAMEFHALIGEWGLSDRIYKRFYKEKGKK